MVLFDAGYSVDNEQRLTSLSRMTLGKRCGRQNGCLYVSGRKFRRKSTSPKIEIFCQLCGQKKREGAWPCKKNFPADAGPVFSFNFRSYIHRICVPSPKAQARKVIIVRFRAACHEIQRKPLFRMVYTVVIFKQFYPIWFCSTLSSRWI
jgi:hypothetical protein